jgi:hypothetical protein
MMKHHILNASVIVAYFALTAKLFYEFAFHFLPAFYDMIVAASLASKISISFLDVLGHPVPFAFFLNCVTLFHMKMAPKARIERT